MSNCIKCGRGVSCSCQLIKGKCASCIKKEKEEEQIKVEIEVKKR